MSEKPKKDKHTDTQLLLIEVEREVEIARTMILNAVEVHNGEDKNWPLLRATLLKSLGDRGLDGRLKALFSNKEVPNG